MAETSHTRSNINGLGTVTLTHFNITATLVTASTINVSTGDFTTLHGGTFTANSVDATTLHGGTCTANSMIASTLKGRIFTSNSVDATALHADALNTASLTATKLSIGGNLAGGQFIKLGTHRYIFWGRSNVAATIVADATAIEASLRGSLYIGRGSLWVFNTDTTATSVAIT